MATKTKTRASSQTVTKNRIPPQIKIFQPGAEVVTPDLLRSWIESGEERAALNVLVTPELASILLEYNTPGETNRPIKAAAVKEWSSALRDGEWENTGEPIIVSNERLLNDGEQRLTAIVETGLTGIADIRFGIQRGAMASTNCGSKRTAADALGLEGVLHTARTASVARMVAAYQTGLPNSARDWITNGKVVRLVKTHPDLVDAVTFNINLGMSRPFRGAALLALTFMARRVANDASVRAFFEQLNDGQQGKRTSPPKLLHDDILSMPNRWDTGSRVRMLAVGIQAWNAWHTATPIRKLGWFPGEEFPKVAELNL